MRLYGIYVGMCVCMWLCVYDISDGYTTCSNIVMGVVFTLHTNTWAWFQYLLFTCKLWYALFIMCRWLLLRLETYAYTAIDINGLITGLSLYFWVWVWFVTKAFYLPYKIGAPAPHKQTAFTHPLHIIGPVSLQRFNNRHHNGDTYVRFLSRRLCHYQEDIGMLHNIWR